MEKTIAKQKITRISIPAKNREKIAGILNALLADAADLSLQIKHAHWNVTGPHFIGLHELFDAAYGRLLPHIDAIAERVATLGYHVKGRLQDAAANSRLDEFPSQLGEGLDFVQAVADGYGSLSNSVRKGIDETDELEDKVTSDMLTGIADALDKDLWFLEAHLRAPLR